MSECGIWETSYWKIEMSMLELELGPLQVGPAGMGKVKISRPARAGHCVWQMCTAHILEMKSKLHSTTDNTKPINPTKHRPNMEIATLTYYISYNMKRV